MTPQLPKQFQLNIAGAFGAAGEAWLERLPGIVAACELRWSLSAGAPFENLSYNYIAPVQRRDGQAAILKIGFPNPELTTEIEALMVYDGRACVRLLDDDRERGALLVERVRPGTTLIAIEDDGERTRIAARVMGRLWRPAPEAHRFPTVERWAAGLARLRARFDGGTGPLPPDLVDTAERLFVELIDSMGKPVLLHGDLHHENILCSEREEWLAIDPKGLVGEPAYEVGALLRNPLPWLFEQSRPRPAELTARRASVLAEALGFDRERILRWGLAQAVLSAWWCIEDAGGCWQDQIHCAEIIQDVLC